MKRRDRWGIGLMLLAIVLRIDGGLVAMLIATAGFWVLTWIGGDDE